MSSDVETILNEIRERVRAEERTAAPPLDVTPQTQSPNGLLEPAVTRNENLERVAADLSVTARSWDRLPPIISNRSGVSARLELWIKNLFKGLTRWFTWEQVNFNAAVHHALKDFLAVVAAERENAAARDQKLEALERECQSLRALLEKQAQEFQHLLSAQATQATQATQAKGRSEVVQARLTETEAALARVNDMLNGLAQQSAETANTLRAEQRLTETELAKQIAETANELRDEQRVCFKQLSLEVSEAAILEDRGRRALDARVEKLERRNSA